MANDEWWQQPAQALDNNARQQAQARQLQLTKPPGSLGLLESIAIDFAGWQGQVCPSLKQPHIYLMAADHGIAQQNVSAFPQAVTIEMLRNFANGGAAIAVIANHRQWPLDVINCGTASPCDDIAGVTHLSIAPATQDFSQGPAMTPQQAQQALRIGADRLNQVKQKPDLVIAGEMGIANTSSASCIAALLTDYSIDQLTGRGTGIDDQQLLHKQQVLKQAYARAKPAVKQAFDVLVEVGGFEIGAIAGLYIRAAQLGIPSCVDGFISSAAALLAVHLNTSVRPWLLFSHQSAEAGHALLLQALAARPLLQLDMRLGEGSGAAVAVSLMEQALQLHGQMATFAEASVSTAK